MYSVKQKLLELTTDICKRDFITDNNNVIFDVKNLDFSNPKSLEIHLNNIPGVVTNGIFALRGADILIIGHLNNAEVIYSKI